MVCVRRKFGALECEIGVQVMPHARPTFMAWAFKVAERGQLEPLYDECGRLYRADASTPEQAVDAIRLRLARRFGPETGDSLPDDVRPASSSS